MAEHKESAVSVYSRINDLDADHYDCRNCTLPKVCGIRVMAQLRAEVA